MSQKRIRLALSLICSVIGLVAAFACSGQPVAPSSFSSSPDVSTTPDVAARTTLNTTTAAAARFGSRTPGVVYVTSQGLFYDTFVVKDPLPMEGRFQLLADGKTEFGPGQSGYLGGRWWEDTNGNGLQDADDHYFLCPLLPPGRPTP